MQIDFHHTVTYVVARAAEFSHQESEIIAYSAQYVDDATDSGLVQFYLGSPTEPKIGPTYTRISSSHKMLDYRNNSELANSRVWIPFHFLPSNDGQKQVNKWRQGEAFLPRLICRPNSPVAQLMVKNCIVQQPDHAAQTLESAQYKKALSRLGITMHVYADTWAHQDFAGVAHHFNELTDIESVNYKLDDDRVKNFASGWLDKLKSKLTGSVLPLGHGPALSYPDLPFLTWRYQRKPEWQEFSQAHLSIKDSYVTRNNTELFIDAAHHMYTAMCAFRNGNNSVDLTQLVKMPDEYVLAITGLFEKLQQTDSLQRHQEWLQHINENNYFPFDMADHTLHYDVEEKQWKNAILKNEVVFNVGSPFKKLWNDGKKVLANIAAKRDWDFIQIEYQVAYQYPENNEFLNSQWKLFHDALMEHRQSLSHEVFPLFNICAS